MNCSKFEEGGSDERMDATYMSVSLHLKIALVESARLFHSSVRFQLVFLLERLYDIHVT